MTIDLLDQDKKSPVLSRFEFLISLANGINSKSDPISNVIALLTVAFVGG